MDSGANLIPLCPCLVSLPQLVEGLQDRGLDLVKGKRHEGFAGGGGISGEGIGKNRTPWKQSPICFSFFSRKVMALRAGGPQKWAGCICGPGGGGGSGRGPGRGRKASH